MLADAIEQYGSQKQVFREIEGKKSVGALFFVTPCNGFNVFDGSFSTLFWMYIPASIRKLFE